MTWLLNELPRINAIRVGKFYHKPSAVHGILSRSVRLVAHEKVYEGESTFSGCGSCTLISYRDQYFVVVTRHELHLPRGENLSDGPFETIRFSTVAAGYLRNIPVDRCWYEMRNPDEEYHDLLFLVFNVSGLKPARIDHFSCR